MRGSFKNEPYHHHDPSSQSFRAGEAFIHGGHERRDEFDSNCGMFSTTSVDSGRGIGKREENRRTLTNFKIVDLKIRSLD